MWEALIHSNPIHDSPKDVQCFKSVVGARATIKQKNLTCHFELIYNNLQ